ncbi:hypothetical protein NC652_005468 [Populus alba x Populus x berolinensis]|nr:hypothetical protein NC652_005468 [Populus alba x Populus x berolinensis]
MLPLPVENELGCVGGVQLFPGKVTGLIFSSGDEIPAYEIAWHFPITAKKQKPTWFGCCQKKKSKKGEMKHLAGMEHTAGPVAFNKIGINSLVQRERKNSKHPKIGNLVISKLTSLKICL